MWRGTKGEGEHLSLLGPRCFATLCLSFPLPRGGSFRGWKEDPQSCARVEGSFRLI